MMSLNGRLARLERQILNVEDQAFLAELTSPELQSSVELARRDPMMLAFLKAMSEFSTRITASMTDSERTRLHEQRWDDKNWILWATNYLAEYEGRTGDQCPAWHRDWPDWNY